MGAFSDNDCSSAQSDIHFLINLSIFMLTTLCTQSRLKSTYTQYSIRLCLTGYQENVVSHFVWSDSIQQNRIRQVGPCIIGLTYNLPPTRHVIFHLYSTFSLEAFSSLCRVVLVVSVSASRTVGREFASRSGHTKDRPKNVTNCLSTWHAMR